MHKPKKSRKLLWIILALIIIAVSIGGFFLYRTGSVNKLLRGDVVARVGNHNITKQEVQQVKAAELAAGFYGDSDETIKKLIMDYWLYSMAAEEYGIKPNDTEALENLKNKTDFIKLSSDQAINNSYVKYRAYKDYYQKQLTTILNSPQKGAYIIAHFDQNFGRDTTALKALSDQQYQDLLKVDRDYATNFINDVYAKIKSGQITFEEGMKMQLDNKIIGKVAMSTAVMSAKFGQPSNIPGGQESIVKNSQIQAKVNELQAGGISEPFIVKVPAVFTQPNNLVDGFWVIVKVDSTNSGPKFDSVNAALQHFKQKYGYEEFK